MSEPIIYPGMTVELFDEVFDIDNAVYLADVDVASAVARVVAPDGTVVLAPVAMTYVAGRHGWITLWPIDATAPAGEYQAEFTVVDLAGNVWPSFDQFTVVAKPGTPPPWTSLVGAPWMSVDDLSLCDAPSFDTPDAAALVLAGATDMLYVASGRQFPGVCTDTIRPASTNLPGIAGMSMGAWPRTSDGGTWAPFGGIDLLPEATFGGVGGVRGDSVLSGFRVASTVRLPGYPIVDVLDVQIGDVHLTHGVDYFIVDDRWLIRANNLSWPWTERMDRTDTVDLWSVTYTYGEAPPAAGLIALQVLVCELGKAFKGDKSCRLPKRLQSITREGMTAVILDPFSFLDSGRFGLYEVDAFIAQVNPDSLDRDGKVLNVDLVMGRPRHVR